MSFDAGSQVDSKAPGKLKLVMFQAIFLSVTFCRRTVGRLSIMAGRSMQSSMLYHDR